MAEGMKEDKASRGRFHTVHDRARPEGRRARGRRRGARLVATVGEMLPQAGYQRCMVHFMRNVLSKVPPTHREWASAAPEAIFAMEITRVRPRQGRGGRPRDGVQETESGGLLPEGRYRRDHDLAARRVSPGAPAAIRTNNMIRTPQQGDPPAHRGRRQLPRRQERAHAHLRQDPIRHRQRLVEPPLPGHVPTR